MAPDLWEFVDNMAEMKGVSSGRVIEERVRAWRTEVLEVA